MMLKENVVGTYLEKMEKKELIFVAEQVKKMAKGQEKKGKS